MKRQHRGIEAGPGSVGGKDVVSMLTLEVLQRSEELNQSEELNFEINSRFRSSNGQTGNNRGRLMGRQSYLLPYQKHLFSGSQ
jgi:hypothetical protein